MKIVITDHAYDRAKERFSLNRNAFLRQAEKVFDQGLKHSDTKGKLKKYLDKLWLTHKTSNNVRIHGEMIYFFKDNVLITVFQLPLELRKYVKFPLKN